VNALLFERGQFIDREGREYKEKDTLYDTEVYKSNKELKTILKRPLL
jgi:hypothetical protein